MCPVCQNDFIPNPKSKRRQIYCSPRCVTKASRERNKTKRRQYSAEYYELHREERREYAKLSYRRRAYGLSFADFLEMVAAQDNKCGICGSSAWGGTSEAEANDGPHIDHDHDTGAVRGLLCRSCNIGLGNFRDNSGLLRSAADYLDKHRRREGGNNDD